MLAMNALAVLTEEGRMYVDDNTGEATNSQRSGGFRIEQSIPIESG